MHVCTYISLNIYFSVIIILDFVALWFINSVLLSDLVKVRQPFRELQFWTFKPNLYNSCNVFVKHFSVTYCIKEMQDTQCASLVNLLTGSTSPSCITEMGMMLTSTTTENVSLPSPQAVHPRNPVQVTWWLEDAMLIGTTIMQLWVWTS